MLLSCFLIFLLIKACYYTTITSNKIYKNKVEILAKTTNFTNENGVDLVKLCAWIGAVVDAHPTTISADGNEEYLVEALAVINSKVEYNYILPRKLKTHFSWNYYPNMIRLKNYLWKTEGNRKNKRVENILSKS